jgi:hypothetical protein
MKLTEKEIQNILRLAAFERYKYFIKRVADFEFMFGLKDKHQNLALAELDGKILLSLWSAKEFAELSAIEEWYGYSPFEINLNYFEREIIPYAKKNGCLLNVFPTSDRTGFIVTLEEFVRDLNIELEKYE